MAARVERPVEHEGGHRDAVLVKDLDGSRRSGARRLLWRSLASGLVIGLLSWFVPLDDLRAALSRVDPWLAMASIAMVVPMAATKAAIFWLAASVQGLVFSVGQMLRIQLASAFYTLVTPGQLGGTVSRWYMMQRPGRQPIEAAAVMLMARYLETTLACVIGLMLALADPLARDAGVVPAIFGFVVLLSLVSLFLFSSRIGRRAMGRLLEHLPDHRWLGPVRRAVPTLRDAGSRMRTMQRGVICRVLALSLLWNGLGIASIAFAAAAVGAEVSWLTLGWLRSLLALILILPLAWGGLGLREASVAAMLQPYGVPPALAIGIGALVSLRNILEAVIGGVVELVVLWRRRGGERHETPTDSATRLGERAGTLDVVRPAR